MPFFEPFRSEPEYINRSLYKPVDVIACTFADGKIQPMRCKYELPDESLVTVNIEGIKLTKEIRGGVSFACVATMYGRKIDFTLAYFFREHTWFIAKS